MRREHEAPQVASERDRCSPLHVNDKLGVWRFFLFDESVTAVTDSLAVSASRGRWENVGSVRCPI